MKTKLRMVSIRDLTKGYQDNKEEGVVSFGGKLDIRPKYQREFVYNDKNRNAVIETVMQGCPLSIMYWVKNLDGNFELLDGQQRTLSICEYIEGNFSVDVDGNPKNFHNLSKEDQDKILNYEITVYECEGTDKEKLAWFKKINTATATFTDQEVRNAVYTGPWLTDAKRFLSKVQGAGVKMLENYASGSSNRQELLEKVLSWMSNNEIEEYMSKAQHNKDAAEIRKYVDNIVSWIEKIFTVERREMKQVDWGELYREYGKSEFNSKTLEANVKKLMEDDSVTKKAGIYPYVLSPNKKRAEKYLNIRAFSDTDKRVVFEKQKGVCLVCKDKFKIDEMQADHKVPWSKGGQTVRENCQMLCVDCNASKSDK